MHPHSQHFLINGLDFRYFSLILLSLNLTKTLVISVMLQKYISKLYHQIYEILCKRFCHLDHINFKIGLRGTAVFESPVQKWLLTPEDITHYHPSNTHIYNFNKTFFKVIRQIDLLKKNLFKALLSIITSTIMVLFVLEYFVYDTLEGPVQKSLLNLLQNNTR